MVIFKIKPIEKMNKKLLLISIAFLIFESVYPQNFGQSSYIYKYKAPKTNAESFGRNVLVKSSQSLIKNSNTVPSYGDTVGYTWYDYQSNGSMQNRINVDANNNIQVVWTKALDTIQDPTNANRGIGYNYYNSSSQTWNPGDSLNTNFGLADTRVGWPTIANNNSNREIIIAHPNKLYRNDAYGSSNWSDSVIDLAQELHWDAASSLFYHSSTQGKSIYTTYLPNDPSAGRFNFARSDDDGNTWFVIESLDSTLGIPLGLQQGDAVDIDSKGDTVVILAGGIHNYYNLDISELILFLSTNRGVTWNYTVVSILDTSNAIFNQFDGSYNLIGPYGDPKVLIGNDGTIHCTGSVFGVKTEPGTLDVDSGLSLTRGIWYWNNTMNPGFDLNLPADYSQYVLVDSVPDITTSGRYPQNLDEIRGIGSGGLFTRPSISTDSLGYLYIIYSGICAGSNISNPDSIWRRDLYGFASIDSGSTWTNPINIADLFNASDFTDGTAGEEVFPSTPKRLSNNSVHILYQYDPYAGSVINDPLAIHNENKLVYAKINAVSSQLKGGLIVVSGLENALIENSIKIFPNPAQGNVTLSFNADASGEIEINIANMIGQSMKLVSKEIRKGENAIQINISDLSKGVYLVTLGSGENKITQKLIIE